MPTIPANNLVSVIPSVLAASGDALDIIGLILTTNTRVPMDAGGAPTVQSFPSAAAVSSFFGASSREAEIAAIYFAGFTNATKLPGDVLFAQYPEDDVAAYLRGGDISDITVSTLQGYNGTLSVDIDEVTETASINLSGATSFSNAAQIIGAALDIHGVESCVGTGSVGGSFLTCTTTGTVLTIGTVSAGRLWPGDTVTANDGTNTLNATIVSQSTGTPGGSAGATFVISAAASPGNLTSSTVTAVSNVLTMTAIASGDIEVSDVVTGTGIATGIYISGLGTGTGGVGTYTMNGLQDNVASTTITLYEPGVIYDSVAGAFVIRSGTVGEDSAIDFASGALATNLLLTEATGAVVSYGADAAAPAAYMNLLLQQTQNWATFMTMFDPDVSGSTNKQAFAGWKNTALGGNRFAYVCFDTDPDPTNSNQATSSLGYILEHNADSGTFLLWAEDADSGADLAAFACGAAASIDFERTNGRITFAYKWQAGLTADVTDETVASNLIANGYNFGGAYGSANQTFVMLQNGQVTGEFNWFDSYINQIWLNNALQLAGLVFLNAATSVPYNSQGYAAVENALREPITAGLNFGAYAPGDITASQAAKVNADAGLAIAPTLQTQGWYLQVSPASASQRAARGSPPTTFWYLDRGSIQALTIASIGVQ
jgi:hypothetical protein